MTSRKKVMAKVYVFFEWPSYWAVFIQTQCYNEYQHLTFSVKPLNSLSRCDRIKSGYTKSGVVLYVFLIK